MLSLFQCAAAVQSPHFLRAPTHQGVRTHVQQRVHQVFTESSTPFPDSVLAKKFTHYGFEEHLTRSFTFQRPKTIETYLQVAHLMHMQGLIPLVHGRNMTWFIPEYILGRLGCSGCQLLRDSTVSQVDRASVKKLIDERMRYQEARMSYWMLPKLFSRISYLDHVPELRRHLLSATVGLFHSEHSESPLSFVYGGSSSKYFVIPGNRSVLPDEEAFVVHNEMIRSALKAKGYDTLLIDEFLLALKPLFGQALAFNTGYILVIGMPRELCEQFVYHCKPLGIPTGISMTELFKKIERVELPKEGCQTRFIICKEMMSSASGIQVVNIMDEVSQRAFTKGICFEPLKEQYRELLTRKRVDNSWEETEVSFFTDFKSELDSLVSRFERMKLNLV